MGVLDESPAAPKEFLEWAISNDLPVSDALKQSVDGAEKLVNWKAQYFRMKKKRDALNEQINEAIAAKERTSFLRMILGMARAKFGHTAAKPAIKMIEGTLSDQKLSVSDDVIRRLLNEAEEKLAE